MPGERVLSESPEKRPAQRTQAEVDKAIKTAELKVGDIVQTDDGARLITQIDRSHQKFKSEPVKFEHDKWQKDPSRNTKILTEKDISLVRARNVNTPEIMNLINESQRKTQELHKQQKEPVKERSVSFSVITKGDTDGYVVGGNSYETIVYGKTTNNISYKASLSGNVPVSKTTLSAIADGIAKSKDFDNEKLDERQALDDIRDIISANPSIEAVAITGGPTITRDEIAIEVSRPNGTEYITPINPDGDIKDDIEFDANGDGKDDNNQADSRKQYIDFDFGDSEEKKNTKTIDFDDLSDLDNDDAFSIDSINAFCFDEDEDEPVLGGEFDY